MFQVNLFMGEGDYQAKEVALVINNKVVPKDHYKLDGNRLTIFGEAFKELPNGSYAVAVICFSLPVSSSTFKITSLPISENACDFS